MRHGAPGMVGRRWLRVPDVTGVAGELTAFQRGHDGVADDDLRAGGVDDVGAATHRRQQLLVEEVIGLRV